MHTFLQKGKVYTADELVSMRRRGIIDVFTSISWYIQLNELYINTEAGRIVRPLLIVDNNKLRIKKKHIEDLKNNKIKWNDLILPQNGEEGVIEYIDSSEANVSMIAMTNSNNTSFSNCNQTADKYMLACSDRCITNLTIFSIFS